MVGPSFPSVTMVRPNPPIWKNDEKIWKPRKNKGKLSPIWKNPGNTVLSLWGVAISISIYIYIYLYIYIYIYSIYIYIYIYRVWIFTVKHEYRIGCNGIYHQQCDGEIMIFFVERTAKDEI